MRHNMRIVEARGKRGPKGGLMGAVMGLVFGAGFFLSLVAPTEVAGSSADIGTPEAAVSASTPPDGIPPGEASAGRDTLDLQLD